MRWLVVGGLLAVTLCLAMLAWTVTSLERRSAPQFSEMLVQEQMRPASLRPAPRGPAASAWLPDHPGPGAQRLANETLGFYMPWDAASRRSLRAHVGQLSWVAAGLVSVRGRDHQWIEAADAALKGIMAGSPRARLLLMIQNDSETGWDGANMARLLANPQKRRSLLDKVAKAMVRHGAAGVFFDIEDLPASAHRDYRTLLAEARTRLPAEADGSAATVMLAAPLPTRPGPWCLCPRGGPGRADGL